VKKEAVGSPTPLSVFKGIVKNNCKKYRKKISHQILNFSDEVVEISKISFQKSNFFLNTYSILSI
jgi:hypothetical protein